MGPRWAMNRLPLESPVVAGSDEADMWHFPHRGVWQLSEKNCNLSKLSLSTAFSHSSYVMYANSSDAPRHFLLNHPRFTGVEEELRLVLDATIRDETLIQDALSQRKFETRGVSIMRTEKNYIECRNGVPQSDIHWRASCVLSWLVKQLLTTVSPGYRVGLLSSALSLSMLSI